jgi:hypothetical protein
VVVGDLVREGVTQENAAIGETTNLAARLQAIAEPSTLVIAPQTYRLVGALRAETACVPLPTRTSGDRSTSSFAVRSLFRCSRRATAPQSNVCVASACPAQRVAESDRCGPSLQDHLPRWPSICPRAAGVCFGHEPLQPTLTAVVQGRIGRGGLHLGVRGFAPGAFARRPKS